MNLLFAFAAGAGIAVLRGRPAAECITIGLVTVVLRSWWDMLRNRKRGIE